MVQEGGTVESVFVVVHFSLGVGVVTVIAGATVAVRVTLSLVIGEVPVNLVVFLADDDLVDEVVGFDESVALADGRDTTGAASEEVTAGGIDVEERGRAVEVGERVSLAAMGESGGRSAEVVERAVDMGVRISSFPANGLALEIRRHGPKSVVAEAVMSTVAPQMR